MKSILQLSLFLIVSVTSGQIRPLAQDHVAIWTSPDPARIYCYTPAICRLPSGRLVVTHEISSAGKPVPPDNKPFHEARVMTSDDGGKIWTQRHTFNLTFARPFVAGKSLYIVGMKSQVGVLRSDDDGITWSEQVSLNDKGIWHQSACNVLFTKGNVYLVMEKHAPLRGIQGWQVGDLAPVLMRAKADSDLLDRKSWTFASELVFEDLPESRMPNAFGFPFHPMDRKKVTFLVPPKGRSIAPAGWLETNVVQFTDPQHLWHDPAGKTFYLWMRANTGMTNYAAIAQVKENEDGSMTTSVVKSPAGTPMLFVPCPGGQMRFHVEWDEKTKLYWLLGSQTTDSMIRPDAMPKDRWGTPDNERHRLVLHFSKNMIDWCFAGVVSIGATPKESRHYASMCIDGEDLVIVSRSGDEKAHSAHNGNLITFHRVQRFRSLVY
ncbi:sialidase family protein [Brevifollis gellanilyticus]|uniref:sialidase family protein n=1 Tax=Brevifollis gellanilyticus TaxID=748831 RepID=UPI0011BEC11C|nr:sialidase family protein [Brevifollis gellanilyticus]